MLIKEKVYIPYLNQERTLHIYVPDHQKQERFPVLYMFDGHNLFLEEDATYGKSWGLKKYFDKHEIQMIIVGIECNHENNERLNEFSPYSFCDEYWGSVHASGKLFLEWMSSDLKFHIDTHYSTLSDAKNTFIGGSSMGGLMAIYGGSLYSHIYSKAICISIFLEYIVEPLKEDLLHLGPLHESSFYISLGQKEYRSKKRFAIEMENNLSLSRILQKKKAQTYIHCFIHGEHNEASWEKEIPIFLEDLNLINAKNER